MAEDVRVMVHLNPLEEDEAVEDLKHDGGGGHQDFDQQSLVTDNPPSTEPRNADAAVAADSAASTAGGHSFNQSKEMSSDGDGDDRCPERELRPTPLPSVVAAAVQLEPCRPRLTSSPMECGSHKLIMSGPRNTM